MMGCTKLFPQSCPQKIFLLYWRLPMFAYLRVQKALPISQSTGRKCEIHRNTISLARLLQVQVTGLAISIASMVMNFMGKQKKGGHDHHGGSPPAIAQSSEEVEKILGEVEDDDEETGDVELAAQNVRK